MAGGGPVLYQLVHGIGLGIAELADMGYQLVEDMGLILCGTEIPPAFIAPGKGGHLIIL